ncbi:flagellar biosynthesis protein FlgL [Sulfurimonas sp.]|uniref:flagellin N-terminal helical domain-containing protein n=1 Tax=Sulfurimonas sp. TaxID=2022749 RepID=UPI003564DC42
MRISSSMYYKSLYSKNNSNLQNKLFDVNKQIASGLSIQYAHNDVRKFAETMRLDNEIEGLGQIIQSTESGFKMANQTDQVLNEFTTTMDRMRVLMINAANGIHSDGSLDAIADELRVVEEHFKNLANTSINGQYLFSGSAVDVRPISPDGTYMGNGGSMASFTGSKTEQQYNISGEELFLGEKALVRRRVTTNVINENLVQSFPPGNTEVTEGTHITPDNSIRQLMGDTDGANANLKHHFYIRGVKSDGTAFNKEILMSDTDTVQDLMDQIGNAYGNTNALTVVDISMNLNGQIVIEDKRQGSSKLEFHMVGATDFDEAGPDFADINDAAAYGANVGQIDNLDGGETIFNNFVIGATPPGLFVKEFVKSDYNTVSGLNVSALAYDRTYFEKDAANIKGTIPQIIRDGNGFATESTKLSEVADLTQGTAGTLDGTQLSMVGVDVNGAALNVQIDLNTAGSTFSLDGGITNYDIFDMDPAGRKAVPADEMTYQQLLDVINMVTSGQIPATTNVDTDYDTAIESSNLVSSIHMDYDGKISYQQLNVSNTLTEISLFDSNSGDFSVGADSSVMSFNSNNAVEVRDPKTDFFKVLDTMITAVEDHKLYADASIGTTRSVGIEDAIAMIDDLQDHVLRSHAKVGSQVNALTSSLERTEILEISAMTLRSKTIDTDLAEASLMLTQLSINYESMLSTVGKVSKLNLVNYL